MGPAHALVPLVARGPVIGSVVSAKIGGNAMVWHTRLGLMVLSLLVFRLAWGFVGGRWSRFSSFFYGPRSVLAYLRGERPGATTWGTARWARCRCSGCWRC